MGSLGPAAKSTAAYLDLHRSQFATFIQRDAPAYRNGAPVHLTDVGELTDSVEDLRNAGIANGKPAILIIIFRQPNANIVGTVDRVMAELPELRASISPAIDVEPMVDRSVTIRASLAEVERTLVLSPIYAPARSRRHASGAS